MSFLLTAKHKLASIVPMFLAKLIKDQTEQALKEPDSLFRKERREKT